MKETHDSLEMIFKELLIEGQSFATRTVRLELGTHFFNDVIDKSVMLPRVSKKSRCARRS